MSVSLRTVLRSPPHLRVALLQNPRALYHSYEHNAPSPYGEAESAILSASLTHVPTSGFTPESLLLGAKDAGYLDISTNLFPKGPFELVKYHLVTQRLALKDRIQFPDEKMGVGRKVRALVLERLRANADAGVVGRWQEALGLMSFAENIPQSLKELSSLSDEIWFLAGDVSVDTSWYTKRASLASVYAATEIYQSTDQSTDFRDTEQFLDRRLDELRVVGGSVSNTLQWAGFQGGAFVNLLRSKAAIVKGHHHSSSSDTRSGSKIAHRAPPSAASPTPTNPPMTGTAVAIARLSVTPLLTVLPLVTSIVTPDPDAETPPAPVPVVEGVVEGVLRVTPLLTVTPPLATIVMADPEREKTPDSDDIDGKESDENDSDENDSEESDGTVIDGTVTEGTVIDEKEKSESMSFVVASVALGVVAALVIVVESCATAIAKQAAMTVKVERMLKLGWSDVLFSVWVG